MNDPRTHRAFGIAKPAPIIEEWPTREAYEARREPCGSLADDPLQVWVAEHGYNQPP